MLPLHLLNAAYTVPLDIVDDNARKPSEELLEKTCSYRRKRASVSSIPTSPAPLQPGKPSRWDAIPVCKNVPMKMKIPSMSLNECARMSVRRPERWLDEKQPMEKLSQPLRRPTRSSGYADAASILELALSEVDFGTDDLSDDFSDIQITSSVGMC